MKLVDSTMRYAVPNLGVGVRWLKDELRSRGVTVKLTSACLRELVMDADNATRVQVSGPNVRDRYVTVFRQES